MLEKNKPPGGLNRGFTVFKKPAKAVRTRGFVPTEKFGNK